MSLLERISTPFCDVLMLDSWDAPARRCFAAVRARHGFRWLLGHVVLEEFGTLSSPVFLAPRALLGRIYDAGITLAHRRDHEMSVDLGWPPLCIGLERAGVDLPPEWQPQLIEAIEAGAGPLAAEPVETRAAGGDTLALARYPAADRAGTVTVIVTTAPLLPVQLARVCDLDDAGLTLALATGNRVSRQPQAQPQRIAMCPESRLQTLLAAADDLLHARPACPPAQPG
jgi:hypothetical protein